MRAHIKKLQSKSEQTRKQILIGSIIVCMSLVIFVWVSSLGHKFNKETSTNTQEEIKPFAIFGQTIKDTVNDITTSTNKAPSAKEETDNQINLNPINSN